MLLCGTRAREKVSSILLALNLAIPTIASCVQKDTTRRNKNMCETSNKTTRTLAWDGEVPFGAGKTRARVVFVQVGENNSLMVECTTKNDAMGEPHWEQANSEFAALVMRKALLALLADKK
jgi:hypothetical protein